MEQHVRRQIAVGALTVCVAIVIFLSRCAHAADVPEMYPDEPAPHAPQTDLRMGGVLAESYQYHRQSGGDGYVPHSTIAPPNGWYGYGFPVQSYRWGWFGAGRYYPHVVWHRNYYNDCCRHAYRYGY